MRKFKMSSSIDSGYYANEASKSKDEDCPKGGKHKWKRYGSWPSIWEKCEKCGKSIYWK